MYARSIIDKAEEPSAMARAGFRALDPLSDSRWDEFVAAHPRSTAFHQTGWVLALAETYGYRPVVFSTADDHPLRDGIIFCEVRSRITGTRLVSLPFADHCEPLVENMADFLGWLNRRREGENWQYAELRPLVWSPDSRSDLKVSGEYWFHLLDVTAPLDDIFQRFHKDCIQRRILRAEREKLEYEVGTSETTIRDFYRLLLRTRKRHHLIPQPVDWFRNLARYLGSAVQIRIVRKGSVPIAAMLTLRHKKSIVYKYGCSDERAHHFGAMPFLFWKMIEESKAAGVESIDLGRSDLDHESLATFKDRLGAARTRIGYVQLTGKTNRQDSRPWASTSLRRLISLVPDAVLPLAGRALYRHLG